MCEGENVNQSTLNCDTWLSLQIYSFYFHCWNCTNASVSLPAPPLWTRPWHIWTPSLRYQFFPDLKWESWPQTRRCYLSFLLLHTWLLTAPVRDACHLLMKPEERWCWGHQRASGGGHPPPLGCLEILWPFLHCIKMRSHQGTAVDLASLLNLTICLWVVGRGWNTGENPQGQWKYASFTQPPTNQHCCLKAKLLLLGTMEDPYTSIVPHEELNLLQHKGLKWKWRLEQEKTVFS